MARPGGRCKQIAALDGAIVGDNLAGHTATQSDGLFVSSGEHPLEPLNALAAGYPAPRILPHAQRRAAALPERPSVRRCMALRGFG